jgi:hypothetical protein
VGRTLSAKNDGKNNLLRRNKTKNRLKWKKSRNFFLTMIKQELKLAPKGVRTIFEHIVAVVDPKCSTVNEHIFFLPG